MWDDLSSFKSNFEGEVWCVLGYFNSTCYPSERRCCDGSSQSSSFGRINFFPFISRMELLDLS